jgi:hypothetical protein
MIPQQLLDPLPILAVFVVFALLAAAAYEVGFRIGRWWQKRTPDEKEGPTSMLVGSILALLAFLLAVTMGMASDRFDQRRALVLAEANAIGTTYLRAGYLPEPTSSETRELLRAYAPLRVNVADREQLVANFARSAELLDAMWLKAEALARTTDRGELVAIYIESLNETIDLHETRVTALIYARVPETILLLLLAGSILTLGMVGYNAGLTGKRSVVTAIALVVALGAVLTVIVDLDRPREGFLQVSQQPLLDVQEQIGPPASR